MTIAAKPHVYPLEAVRNHERWSLEALQSRLGTATAERVSASQRHGHLVLALRSATTSAAVTTGSAIDTGSAGRQLRYIEELRAAVVATGRALDTADAICEGLRQEVMAQHVRLESIERHRQIFQRQAAREAERQQSIEAEREWLARSAWTTRSENRSDRASASVRPAPEEAPS